MKSPKISMIIGLLFIISTCLFASNAFAASWYRIKIAQLGALSSGVTFLQVTPGTNETRFTGTARVSVPRDGAGSNKILALALTAQTVNSEAYIYVETTPSWDTSQQIAGFMLIKSN